VGITPTYSGCPATEVIRVAVRAALDAGGHVDAVLEEVLSPPWTSQWLTSAAHAKLRAFGIAPPQEPVSSPRRLWHAPLVTCRAAPAVRRARERVRLDALQGALPLQRLHGAFPTTSSPLSLNFIPLKVAQVVPDAEDAVAIALEVPAQLRDE